MQATLYSYSKIIGYTFLEVKDKSMGAVSGKLRVTEEYNNLRSIFKKNYPHSDPRIIGLRLNLQLSNGCFIFPGNIHVEDFENEINIYAAGVHSQIIDNYIATETPAPFLEEPWYILDIRQKIGYENELIKEIVEEKNSVTDLISGKPHRHVLTEYNCSAYASYSPNDDVLFEIQGPNPIHTFAVVHLTWTGKLERAPDYPNTRLYHSFDDFKYFRMYPDRNEWES